MRSVAGTGVFACNRHNHSYWDAADPKIVFEANFPFASALRNQGSLS
jgi:hypothetical protein